MQPDIQKRPQAYPTFFAACYFLRRFLLGLPCRAKVVHLIIELPIFSANRLDVDNHSLVVLMIDRERRDIGNR
jgi:hypothetical protein